MPVDNNLNFIMTSSLLVIKHFCFYLFGNGLSADIYHFVKQTLSHHLPPIYFRDSFKLAFKKSVYFYNKLFAHLFVHSTIK